MRILSGALLFVLLSCSLLHGADHAVIFLYHHVSSETPPSTSVTPEVFREHLQYLARGGFNVLPLSKILQILSKGEMLPEKTVAITFDDAYKSVFDQAMPMLKEKKWPFTVFVNSQALDSGYRKSMSWSDIRTLLAAGAEIGNHSHSHAHLVRHWAGESDREWHARVKEDILVAQQRLEAELGIHVHMFAYPYGEHTPELQRIVDELGLFGIAQQSGGVGVGSNMLAVSRFPMATNYSDMSRFAVSANARPLPVTDVSAPENVLVSGTTSQYQFAFTIQNGEYRTSALACYTSSGEKLILRTEESDTGIRVLMDLPDWKAGRRKINCTAPSSRKNGVYYWYSHLWLVKQQNGQWYEE